MSTDRMCTLRSVCLVDYLFLKALQSLETDMPFMSSLTSYGWLIKNLLSWYQTQDHSNRGKDDMRETQVGFFPLALNE